MPGGRIDILINPDFSGFDGKLRSGLSGAGRTADTLGKGIGLAIVGGTIAAGVGLKNLMEIGVEYQGQLNTLQSVTQSTGAEMVQVGNLAKQLGSDLTLPATSAADAAAAMTELAKGGLTVNEAMTAAKGTLQLAAAAQIEAAAAAEIQSDALNQFGLEADQAGRVADILANTANAASGEITDMANALKYVGPVAKAIGADIDSVSTSVGLLAVQGIRGEQAGTSLRGIIASLSAPSKAAAAALDELGIKAFDQAGKFVGLRTITEQLAVAKGKMTEAEFAAAAATAFGNEGLTAASALASSGAKAYDDMASAVTRSGGAADVAAAKTKGLGGAWEGLKSQLETTSIGIFEAIDGPLEAAVRSAAKHIEAWNDDVVGGIENAVAAGELFGPALAKSISSRADVIGDAVDDLVGPIADGAIDVLNGLANAGLTAFDDLTDVLGNVVDAAKPVAAGVQSVAEAATEGSGVVSAFASGVGLAGDALAGASQILGPVGALLGNLVEGFADLPGPVQSAVLALVAYKVAQRALGDTTALTGIRQFAGEMRVQQGLAASSGQEVGRLAAAHAAYAVSTVPAIAAARGFTDQVTAVRAGAAAAGEPIGRMGAALGTLVERSPGLSAMRQSFIDASSGAERFGTAAGVAAAAGTGLRSAASGLVSALGGPLGLAIAGAGVGLSLLGSSQQEAAAAAQRHSSAVGSLANALRESNGAIDANVRSLAAKRLQEEGVFDLGRELGITVESLTDAYLGNKDAVDQVTGSVQAYLNEVANQGQLEGQVAGQNPLAEKAAELQRKLLELLPELGKAARDQKELDQAINGGTASMLKGTESGRTLAGAMKALGDNTANADTKARKLKDALDALTGGQVSLERAQFAVAGSLDRIGGLFAAGGTAAEKAAAQTKGYGDALLNADGSLSSATPNARALRDELEGLVANTSDVATRVYEMSRAAGDDAPTALAKASDAVKKAQDGFVAFNADAGLSAEQLRIVAEKAGLLPSDVRMLIKAVNADETTLELVGIKGALDRIEPYKPITVRTLSEEAEKKLTELGFKVERTPNNVTITATAASAYSSLNAFLNSPATKVVTLVTSYSGRLGAMENASGNILSASAGVGFAQGGLAAAFANGGMARKLTPMQAGLATIVPPNTWRIVGDRLKDDEAYIPINRSRRSIALLSETAERMGFRMTSMFADGGIASRLSEKEQQAHFALLRRHSQPAMAATNSGGPTPGAAAGPVIHMPITVRSDQTAYEVARQTSAQVAWDLRRS